MNNRVYEFMEVKHLEEDPITHRVLNKRYLHAVIL